MLTGNSAAPGNFSRILLVPDLIEFAVGGLALALAPGMLGKPMA